MGSKMVVAKNNLSSNIPVEIGCLKLLSWLDFSHNNFSGNIPNQVSELTNLEGLHLSENQLSGDIPVSLSSLHFLHSFSVAINNLHGPIPLGTQLQSFHASVYEGILDFVALHFYMSVPILLATTETLGMRTMGIKSHGFILLWFWASLQVFGEFAVHWLLVING
jgi:hypothetical protein